jgi:hypothetical protein
LRGVENAQGNRTTLFLVCIQHFIKAIILKQAPRLLEKTHMTEFHVSYAWTKNFIKNQLDWKYCISILEVDKLSKNYEVQGKAMAQ